jgi:hypothetical protein
VYLQLWNEPHDQRDKVEPEDYADYLVAAHSVVHRAEDEAAAAHPELGLAGTFKTMTPGWNNFDISPISNRLADSVVP